MWKQDIFLYGVIVPVIPFALKNRIGLAQNDAQHWVSVLLTVYGAALLVASPVCGWWADKMPTRRWPFLAGLIALTGSTLMLCLAKTLGVLLAARILQGLSAAVAWTVCSVVMTDRVGPDEVGECMGYITLARSVAIVAGPLLGGVVYARAGYYAVFGMCFAFLLVDITCRLLLIEGVVARQWDPSIGPRRRVAANSPNVLSEESRQITTANTSSHVINRPVETEQHVEKRSKLYLLFHRLPPMFTLLGNIRMLIALWGCFWQAAYLSAYDATLPLFVRYTFGWNSSGAGLIFLALVTPSFVSPIIGKLADKYGGARWWAASGYVICAPFFILFRLVDHNSVQQKILLSALLALIGGFSMLFEIPLWVDVIHFVDGKMSKDPTHYGGQGAFAQAFGLANFAFALGVVIGPLWGGFVYHSASWATLNLSLGVVSFLSAVPTVIWIGGSIFEKRRQAEAASSAEIRRGDSLEREKASGAAEKQQQGDAPDKNLENERNPRET